MFQILILNHFSPGFFNQAPPTVYTRVHVFFRKVVSFQHIELGWIPHPETNRNQPQPENQPTGKDLELTCRRWIALEARGHHGAVGAGWPFLRMDSLEDVGGRKPVCDLGKK